ncbi:hypothetical protein GCM10025858_08520 [Alicyclobacillus sacchari]|nr:hypothetical protein GCM10025858_08520 [Alicyclobacillus sacchari]
MSKRALRIGMIGYQFMGKAHSHAFRDLDFFFDLPVTPVLQAIAGRNEEAVRQAAAQYGFASFETDWRRLIERDDIDVIDIVTPNVAHAEMAIAAVQAGKHVICEKPLAMTVDEAVRMREAAAANGVRALVCHNYRYARRCSTPSGSLKRGGSAEFITSGPSICRIGSWIQTSRSCGACARRSRDQVRLAILGHTS